MDDKKLFELMEEHRSDMQGDRNKDLAGWRKKEVPVRKPGYGRYALIGALSCVLLIAIILPLALHKRAEGMNEVSEETPSAQAPDTVTVPIVGDPPADDIGDGKTYTEGNKVVPATLMEVNESLTHARLIAEEGEWENCTVQKRINDGDVFFYIQLNKEGEIIEEVEIKISVSGKIIKDGFVEQGKKQYGEKELTYGIVDESSEEEGFFLRDYYASYEAGESFFVHITAFGEYDQKRELFTLLDEIVEFTEE